LWNYVN
jgi:hypothetical protein